MTFAPIDFVFAALVLLLAARCVLRGFVGETMSIASIVLGAAAAFLLFSTSGAFLRAQFMPNIRVLPEILGFIGIFLIVFFLIKLMENILKDIINRINLTGLDHFFGIILGIAEGGLVACVILFILTIQPLFDAAPLLKGSIFASYLMPLIEWGYYYLLGAGAV